MSIPAYAKYPGPTTRPGTNGFWEPNKPDGTPYHRVMKNASGRLVHVHGAIDLKPSSPGRYGESVYPAFAGRVVFAEPHSSSGRTYREAGLSFGSWGRAFGNRVLVAHSGYHYHVDRNGRKTGHNHRWYTFYAHLDDLRVKTGQAVTTRTILGGMGGSGARGRYSFPPHLHHEGKLDPRYAVMQSGRAYDIGGVDVAAQVEKRRVAEREGRV